MSFLPGSGVHRYHLAGVLIVSSFSFLAWSQSTSSAGKQLYLVGQVQSETENQLSSVTEYNIFRGELRPEHVLLEVKGVPPWQNIFATDKVSDFFFMAFPNNTLTSVRVYDWRTDQLFDPISIDPEQKGTTDNARGYSYIGSDTVCATWPITEKPVTWTEDGRWVGGSSTLASVCASPGKPPELLTNQWKQSLNPVWPGGYVGDNFDNTFILHLDGRIAIPAEAGAPLIPIATVPKSFAADAPKSILEVVVASERYLALRSVWGTDRTSIYVMDRRENYWKVIKQASGNTQYRIFGSLLVASNEDCHLITGDNQARSICVSTALNIRDLSSNQIYLLPQSKDSEVIDIEPDQTLIFREGQALYGIKLGSSLDRSRDVLARGDTVEQIHWAFYR